jgi:HK97 family phage prohead protease
MSREKSKRENASFKKIEVRAIENDGKRVIEGTIPFNSESVPLGWYDEWTEVIDETAFNKTLADRSLVRAFWNHDDSKVLGTTASGTLELEKTSIGLVCRCTLGNGSFANDAWDVISRRDVSTMSFGFETITDKWDYLNDEPYKRHLVEVKLIEVSFGVTFPAYESTNAVALRSHIKAQRGIDLENFESILEKEKFTLDDATALRTIIGTINGMIAQLETRSDTAAEPPKDTPPAENAPQEPPKDTQTEESEKEERERILFEIDMEVENEDRI